MGEIKKIKIKVDTTTHKIEKVKPRCEELCWANKDEVVWEIDPPDSEFKVTFVGGASPFNGNVFFSNQGKCESGKIISSQPLPTYDHFFRYKIDVTGCPDPVDPGIIIW